MPNRAKAPCLDVQESSAIQPADLSASLVTILECINNDNSRVFPTDTFTGILFSRGGSNILYLENKMPPLAENYCCIDLDSMSDLAEAGEDETIRVHAAKIATEARLLCAATGFAAGCCLATAFFVFV